MVGGEVTGSDGGSNVVTGGDGRVLPLFPVTVSHLLSPPYHPTPSSLRPTEEQESSCLLFLLSPSDPLPSLSNTLPVSLPSFSFSRRATRERKKEKESRKGKGKEEISLFLSFRCSQEFRYSQGLLGALVSLNELQTLATVVGADRRQRRTPARIA